jgi:cyclopropane fatty-acyl-phospholipid synthase-like methyltransferase
VGFYPVVNAKRYTSGRFPAARMLIFIEIISLLLLLAMLAWIAFVYLFTRRLFFVFLRGEAPFIPCNAKKLDEISDELKIEENNILYDLGSGDARVLIACFKKQPKAKYIGFEKDIIPYIWSKLRLWRMGIQKNIKIYRRDFFSEDLSKATHIFAYLSPKQMEKLEVKLKKELKNGARLVSLKFKMPNKLTEQKKELATKELFVYNY